MTTTGTDSRRLRLGTRGSRLALTQSGQVADALMAAGGGGAATAAGEASEGSGGLSIDLVTVRTDGDGDRTPLRQLGGVGVFAARLRHALLDGEVDLVVHSFKDLPTQPVEGLKVICVPAREDPRDALCARDSLTLADLPEGARVGTGSPRRAAQLLAARPDLEVVDLRGNVPTRLARVRGLEVVGVGTDEPVAPSRADTAGDLDAVILALSGLRRLGLEHCASEVLDLETMLPAPAQGALAVEARAGEDCAELARAVAALDDEPTRLAVTAERALMARLGAGCAAPVGAWAYLREDSREPWEEHAEHGTGWNKGFRDNDTAETRTSQGAGTGQDAGSASGGPRPVGATDRADGCGKTEAAGPVVPRGSAVSRRSPRVLVLRAVITSLDGGQEVGCELSTELPEASGGPGAPGDTAAVRAAEALGVRAAEVLLEDGADQIVDLHANKPRRD
ncbi:hydroxymethylbilane synthase [Actinomyces oris]|uniref:hydroxymethylbilane synthase n=1 Tax=Actinomyces TaxID=1654 RepID=UPI000949E591|nr:MULTISPECIES: hydroxymethylbilane synthase [Actinomyces]OLL12140.1 hydroxymethylbilane synthase [Actinomyces oris]QLF52476.1 hydroxymethylbilane synthase [Actinomyces sp. oral taxon 169]